MGGPDVLHCHSLWFTLKCIDHTSQCEFLHPWSSLVNKIDLITSLTFTLTPCVRCHHDILVELSFVSFGELLAVGHSNVPKAVLLTYIGPLYIAPNGYTASGIVL